MSQTPRRRSAVNASGRVALALIGATLATALAAPAAHAGPSGDLFNLINAAHVAAGCPAYGMAGQLDDVALQYAKSMAMNNGRTQTTAFHVNTDDLLGQRGYNVSAWGEMDYFKPDGSGSAQDAASFWLSQGTAQLIRNCGVTQMGIAVWILNNNWAASAILGTPGPAPDPGPAPKVN